MKTLPTINILPKYILRVCLSTFLKIEPLNKDLHKTLPKFDRVLTKVDICDTHFPLILGSKTSKCFSQKQGAKSVCHMGFNIFLCFGSYIGRARYCIQLHILQRKSPFCLQISLFAFFARSVNFNGKCSNYFKCTVKHKYLGLCLINFANLHLQHDIIYEGGSKSPCNHLFSLHMGAFIQRWQCLHQP